MHIRVTVLKKPCIGPATDLLERGAVGSESITLIYFELSEGSLAQVARALR